MDKVIEAVSKGLIDDNHDSNIELKRSRVEISPLKFPLVNGVQHNLNDAKVLLEREATAQVKTKASKKVKKEKGKELEKEEESGKDKEKVKQKEKEKDNKEKNRIREKLKRKTKKTLANDLSSSESMTVRNVKDEKFRSNGKDSTETMHHDTEKSDNKIIGQLLERTEMDATIDSTNIIVLNISKDTKSTPEHSLNCEQTANVPNKLNESIEDMATSTMAFNQMSMDRKQNRKHRKEKHRNKHGPDTERSSSKEHKKKRKRKNHDHENAESFPPAGSVPTIKIKVYNGHASNFKE